MSEQLDYMQKLLDSSEVAIYLKDGQGRFLMVNRKLADFFESAIEDVLGKTDYDFASSDQADRWRAQDKKVTEAGHPINFHITTSLPQGDFTFVDHKFPVDIEGHKDCIGGIAVDITEFEK